MILSLNLFLFIYHQIRMSESIAKVIARTIKDEKYVRNRISSVPEEIRGKVAEKLGDILKEKISEKKIGKGTWEEEYASSSYSIALELYEEGGDTEGMKRIGDRFIELEMIGEAIVAYESANKKGGLDKESGSPPTQCGG